MIDSDEMRQAFSRRLNAALDRKGVRHRGRATDIQAFLALMGAKVSTTAIGKWLNGEAIPEKPKIKLLASWLGVSQGELEYGEGRDDGDGVRAQRTARLLPLLTWISAGKLCSRDESLTENDAADWLPSPYPSEEGDYLLTVDGPSMERPDGAGYSDGETLHCRRCSVARHGQDVIARTPDGRMTFKRFVESSEGNYLEALNPSWPDRIIRVPPGTVICAYVVGSGSWKRRG